MMGDLKAANMAHGDLQHEDVVVVGVSNRIEIWAKDKWSEFYGNSRQSFEDIAEKLMDV